MVWLTDHLDITIAVDWDIKSQTEKQNLVNNKGTDCINEV